MLQPAGRNIGKREKLASTRNKSRLANKKGGGENSPPPFRLGQQPAGGHRPFQAGSSPAGAVAGWSATYFLNLKLPEVWQL